MVLEALQAQDGKKGASVVAIKRFILTKYPTVDPVRLKYLLKRALAGDDADGPEGHRDVAGRLPAGGGGGGSGTRRRLRAGPELRPAGRRRAALAAVG